MIASTSTGLLKAIANEKSKRWDEFVARYEEPLRSYLATHFPGVEADDVLQETFAAVADRIKHYRYDPGSKGLFRNYLTGILRHKAIRELEKTQKRLRREEISAAGIADRQTAPQTAASDDEWRMAAMEVALAELLADEAIHSRTREVFRRVAVNGENPQAVAEAFGITANNVRQIKNRLSKHLKALVERMTAL